MKSWEFTDEQKKEIQERQREIGLQFDPETGRRRTGSEGESTGEGEDMQAVERRSRPEKDDDNIR